MKKVLTLVATFILFFLLYVGVSFLLGGTDDVARLMISALITDVIWHILFYSVMPWISKKFNRAK